MRERHPFDSDDLFHPFRFKWENERDGKLVGLLKKYSMVLVLCVNESRMRKRPGLIFRFLCVLGGFTAKLAVCYDLVGVLKLFSSYSDIVISNGVRAKINYH